MPRPAMLDPQRDLKGATPETLAKALLKAPYKPLSSHIGKSVVTDKGSVEKVPADHPGHRTPHLGKGV